MTKYSIAICFFSLTLALAPQLRAQSSLPPEQLDDVRQKVQELSQAELELAQEYELLVEEWQAILDDYQEYFSDYDNVYARKYEALLGKYALRIENGAYFADMEKLAKDISKLQADLAADKPSIKREADNRKIYRTVASLQGQLEVLQGLYDEQIQQRLENRMELGKLVEKYLEQEWAAIVKGQEVAQRVEMERDKLMEKVQQAQQLADSIRDEADSEPEELAELQAELLQLHEELARERAQVYIIGAEIPEVPELVIYTPAPVPPVESTLAPLPPRPPKMQFDARTIVFPESGKVVIAKDYIDSSDVVAVSLPVFINNQTGTLLVRGWDGDKVLVTYSIEVSSDDEALASKFAAGVETKIYSSDKGVFVNSRFPTVSDTRLQIVSSVMDVQVPLANQLVCDNSFGKLEISDMTGGVRVNADHSKVRLDRIEGGIKAANQEGTIEISESSGLVGVQSSRGSIAISGCRGKFEIESSYAKVEVTYCDGPVTVRNSGGEVMVNNHEGDVIIQNSDGPVRVRELSGNLEARNSFQPLIVAVVTGSVTATNQNSAISVEDVEGGLTAENRFGAIVGKYIGGPIKFLNHQGTVSLVADRALRGTSTINADLSTIKLVLSEVNDVTLTASTVGGRILNESFDAGVKADDQGQSLQLTLGRSRNSLDVTGNNSTIVLTDEE